MNNKQHRPRLSEIEIKMILTDMDHANYRYNGKNQESHEETRNRLYNLIKGSDVDER